MRSCVLGYFILIVFQITACGQNEKTPFAPWFFAGVSYQDSGLKISGHYGANDDLNLRVVYLQAFIKIDKNVTFNPAYLYFATSGDDAGNGVKVHSFINSIIISMRLKKLVVEDRNALWSWLQRKPGNFLFYRNRLRATMPFQVKASPASVYMFNAHPIF